MAEPTVTPEDERRYGADLDTRQYGTLEGYPCVWTFSNPKAWWQIDGKWLPINSAEPFNNGRVLTKAEFDKRFPGIDPPET